MLKGKDLLVELLSKAIIEADTAASITFDRGVIIISGPDNMIVNTTGNVEIVDMAIALGLVLEQETDKEMQVRVVTTLAKSLDITKEVSESCHQESILKTLPSSVHC